MGSIAILSILIFTFLAGCGPDRPTAVQELFEPGKGLPKRHISTGELAIPDAPSELIVDFYVQGNDTTGILIKWPPVIDKNYPDKEIAEKMGKDYQISHYIIYRNKTEIATYTQDYKTDADNYYSYPDTNLTKGTYYYQIQAVTNYGVVSAYTRSKTITFNKE